VALFVFVVRARSPQQYVENFIFRLALRVIRFDDSRPRLHKVRNNVEIWHTRQIAKWYLSTPDKMFWALQNPKPQGWRDLHIPQIPQRLPQLRVSRSDIWGSGGSDSTGDCARIANVVFPHPIEVFRPQFANQKKVPEQMLNNAPALRKRISPAELAEPVVAATTAVAQATSLGALSAGAPCVVCLCCSNVSKNRAGSLRKYRGIIMPGSRAVTLISSASNESRCSVFVAPEGTRFKNTASYL
jgi:hypothetical protein